MNNRFTRDVKMNRMYRTPKGTELPILSLRGRDYLEVKYRLVWFREEHPDWSIETEILSMTEQSAYARAAIKDEQGRIIATSHKFETKQGFPDFIEKSETGAIGRALALIGYGTQFCADELDEGERIVDSPVDYTRSSGASKRPAPAVYDDRQPSAESAAADAGGEASEAGGETLSGAQSDQTENASNGGGNDNQDQMLRQGTIDPGDYRVSFGKKYKGKRLSEIPRQEIESYVDWLEANAEKKGIPLSDEARFLKMAVGRYLMESQNH